MASDWIASLRDARATKDEQFASAHGSPLPPADRTDFEGLSYYPPDPDYRFEVGLEAHEVVERLSVGTSTGTEREYLRWGSFSVTIDGESVTIQAYKADVDDERLWVPFRDATSGDETYGAGRYLDLEPEPHRTESGTWILDFNEAYNPTCAYADAYECPLPPPENWLAVPIRAGERRYVGHE